MDRRRLCVYSALLLLELCVLNSANTTDNSSNTTLSSTTMSTSTTAVVPTTTTASTTTPVPTTTTASSTTTASTTTPVPTTTTASSTTTASTTTPVPTTTTANTTTPVPTTTTTTGSNITTTTGSNITTVNTTTTTGINITVTSTTEEILSNTTIIDANTTTPPIPSISTEPTDNTTTAEMPPETTSTASPRTSPETTETSTSTTPTITSKPKDNREIIGTIVGVALVGIVIMMLTGFVLVRYWKTGSFHKICVFRDDRIHQPQGEKNNSVPGNAPSSDLSDLPRCMPIELKELPDVQVRKSKDSCLEFREEYGMLSRLSPRHPQTAGLLPDNEMKNRYRDILPFDHNRVMLSKIEDVENSDYVNASYIPGYKSDQEYIACQGPVDDTLEDHWRMIWEQNVRVIVMVTLCEEGEFHKREKCAQYWPDKKGAKTYGDISVSLLSSEKKCRNNYKESKLDVRNGVETRIVYHFQYLRWPDKQNPQDPEAILDFREDIRDTMLQFESAGPTLVHCSAGVGRSGTYIAVDILLQHIEDHASVDIYGLILKLRNNRVYMVQTSDQYMFVHSTLLRVLENKHKQDIEDGNTYINISEDIDNPYENIPMAKKGVEPKALFNSGSKKAELVGHYRPMDEENNRESITSKSLSKMYHDNPALSDSKENIGLVPQESVQTEEETVKGENPETVSQSSITLTDNDNPYENVAKSKEGSEDKGLM